MLCCILSYLPSVQLTPVAALHSQADSHLLQAAAYIVQLFIILSAQSAS